MINSFELEKQLLAGLIKYPEVYIEIGPFISEDDFDDNISVVNRTIFSVLKNAIENGQHLDHVGLTERINSLGLTFEDNINVGQYIQALDLRKCSPKSILSTAKDLKNITIRREGISKCKDLAKFYEKAPLDTSYENLINHSDNLWNDHANKYDNSCSNPESLFADMEEAIEERGNNPVEYFGLMGPHERMNQLYGAPCQPGNVCVFCARSGVGKTQFTIDLCLETSKLNNNTTVLHLDNGEMSKQELQMRLAARQTGVPFHLIQTGKWRMAGDAVVKKVRSAWPKIKDYNFHYFNVSGMEVEDMINLAKRFYYSKVGRGNQMIINFDYIKTTSQKFNNKQEYQVAGDMIERFKAFSSTFRFDNEPVVSVVTSVQGNRSAISTNRATENIIEDESVIGLSDRIIQVSSHTYLLRKLTTEEFITGSNDATHRLFCLKSRSLGEMADRATSLIRMEDGSLSPNALFYNFDNFNITEVGDLQDLINNDTATATLVSNQEVEEVPDI